jgi:glycosyltransferase involved in cell wall biosynthesis
MWPFTGGCHYDEECGRYKEKCGKCKVLGSKKENDISNKVFKRKEKNYKNLDLTVVGLSEWLNEYSKESALLKAKKHINLPNPIDTNVFKPFSKGKSRELWNLPKDKQLVLFGATNPTGDPRKGFKELSEALQVLKMENVEFVVFGSSEPQNLPKFKFKTHYVGRLNDDISLVTLYGAVDVMIVPSLQENLSNAIMESLSCAIPVVGFDIGGNSDMIEHKKTGYLAKPFETQDLANGIEWVLNLEKSEYTNLCQNAREKVLREFDSRVVAKKYVELYEEVLNG